MTYKTRGGPAEDFISNFAKLMTFASNQQASYWKQAEFAHLNIKQQEQFIEECSSRFQEYLQGVQIYNDISSCRDVSEPPVIWAMGSTRLLDYSMSNSNHAPVVFIVPSLINRSYILDITEDLSFLRKLSKSGVRPFLLDWGDLSESERNFSIEDYMQRMFRAVDHTIEYVGGSRISMLGYCMGGVFTVAAGQLRSEIEKLILVGTPWNFHAGHEWLIPWIQASKVHLETMIDQSSEMSIDLIQYMFTILNPLSVIRKFRKLPKFSDDLKKLEDFANIEDWLNDCVPLAAGVAKECLFGWYLENNTFNNNWKIFDQAIDPGKINQQSLLIIPKHDKIVPPLCAEALPDLLCNNVVLRPNTGHIGAVVGKAATNEVIPAITQFLINN